MQCVSRGIVFPQFHSVLIPVHIQRHPDMQVVKAGIQHIVPCLDKRKWRRDRRVYTSLLSISENVDTGRELRRTDRVCRLT